MLKKYYILLMLTVGTFSINAMQRPQFSFTLFGPSSAKCLTCGSIIPNSSVSSHHCFRCQYCNKVVQETCCLCVGTKAAIVAKAEQKRARKAAPRQVRLAAVAIHRVGREARNNT